jgi:hypothetical protein
MASWREISEPADWEQLLAREPDASEVGRLRHATHTGRPCGDGSFVEQMEQRLGRRLRLGIGGRPLRGQAAVAEGVQSPSFRPARAAEVARNLTIKP